MRGAPTVTVGPTDVGLLGEITQDGDILSAKQVERIAVVEGGREREREDTHR